jgi:hypothetical protein
MKNELGIGLVVMLMLGLVAYVKLTPEVKVVEKPVIVKEVQIKEVPTPVVVEKEKVVEKIVEKPVIVKEVQIEKVPVPVKEVQIEKIPVPVVVEKRPERIVERPRRERVPHPVIIDRPVIQRYYPPRQPVPIWGGSCCRYYRPPCWQCRYPIARPRVYAPYYRADRF